MQAHALIFILLWLSLAAFHSKACSVSPYTFSGDRLLYPSKTTLDPDLVEATLHRYEACGVSETVNVTIQLSTGELSRSTAPHMMHNMTQPIRADYFESTMGYVVEVDECNASVLNSERFVIAFELQNCSVVGYFYNYFVDNLSGRPFLFIFYHSDTYGQMNVAVLDITSLNISFTTSISYFDEYSTVSLDLYKSHKFLTLGDNLSCRQSWWYLYDEDGLHFFYFDSWSLFRDSIIFPESNSMLVLSTSYKRTPIKRCSSSPGSEYVYDVYQTTRSSIEEYSLETGGILHQHSWNETEMDDALALSPTSSEGSFALPSLTPSQDPSPGLTTLSPSATSSSSPSSLEGAAFSFSPSPSVFVRDEEARCFSGEMTVNVLDKGVVSLTDVEIGDQVLVKGGKYEAIYSFGHKNKEASTDFVQLSFQGSDQSLQLTKMHMVVMEGGRVLPASLVTIGDGLLTSDATTASVTEVQLVDRQGIYAPFTPSGTIVVNNIVVSNYVSYQESEYLLISGLQTPFTYQWLAHSFNAMHRMTAVLFGIQEGQETYTPTGISHWVHLPHITFSWVLLQHVAVQICVFWPSIILLGTVSLLEIALFSNFWLSLLTLVSLRMVFNFSIRNKHRRF